MIRHVSSTPSCRVKRLRSPTHRGVQQHLVRGRPLAALLGELGVQGTASGPARVGAVRVDLEPNARRRIELDDELVGLRPAAVGNVKPEPRRMLEDQPHLGQRGRQELAGADVERHAGPAPVVDVEPEGGVGLGGRVRRDSVDLAVAVVLAADVVRRVGLGDRPEERDLRVLQGVGIAAGGHLHRGRGDHLHQVVDDHVAQGPDRVVEVAAVGNAEALGHRDLHALDVVAVPDRLEHYVGEAQVEDLLEAHLSQEVVDPVELRLVDGLVQLAGELPRRRQVVAERLLHHDPGVLGQARVVQALDHPAEQERRDLQVEDRLAGALDRSATLLVGRRLAEVAADVREAVRRGGRTPSASIVSPRPSMHSRACWRSWSTVQSFTATPTIGHVSSPRCSSR